MLSGYLVIWKSMHSYGEREGSPESSVKNKYGQMIRN